jgi:hypothetical protein
MEILINYFFFLVELGLELIVLHSKIGAHLFEPHLQSIMLWLFWRVSHELFAQASLTLLNPPALCLLDSQCYRIQPPAPAEILTPNFCWIIPGSFQILSFYNCIILWLGFFGGKDEHLPVESLKNQHITFHKVSHCIQVLDCW